MQGLFDNYLAVLLATALGFMLVVTAVIGSKLLTPYAATREKATPYECGMLPIGHIRTRIHVRYYVYAFLFLIFDVEAVFLFPWALSLTGSIAEAALYSMVLFIVILGAGLGYAWKKGAMEWK